MRRGNMRADRWRERRAVRAGLLFDGRGIIVDEDIFGVDLMGARGTLSATTRTYPTGSTGLAGGTDYCPRKHR